MSIKFSKVSNFNRGILFELLADAYSFDCTFVQRCSSDWKACDNFYFDNLQIADQCGFITTLNDEAIGFVLWDPRNMPEYAEIGHNCVTSKHKGNGYGKIQLQEAVNRISQNDVRKIIVTTNEVLTPAQRMYESVGFKIYQRRKNESITVVFRYICGGRTKEGMKKQSFLFIFKNINKSGIYMWSIYNVFGFLFKYKEFERFLQQLLKIIDL